MTTSRKHARTMAERRTQAVRRARGPVGTAQTATRSTRVAAGPKEATSVDPMQETREYAVDVWERTILFWDTLRQRADNMLEHERAGLPPLLDFKYETLLDARHFEQPAN